MEDGRRGRLGRVGGGRGSLHRRRAPRRGAVGRPPRVPGRGAVGVARRGGALALGLDPTRSYGDVATLARAEAARPDGMEAAAIVTPNHLHAPAAHAFLDAGVHVICDKPLTTSLAEAVALADHA